MHGLVVYVHLNCGPQHDRLEFDPHVGWEVVVDLGCPFLAITGDVQIFVGPREVAPSLGNQAA